MCASIVFGLLLSVLINSAAAACTLDDVNNCLTEFANFVSPKGIILSEQKVAAVCTYFHEETLLCLYQCSGSEAFLIKKTETFINTKICQPDSNFRKTLHEKGECIVNASEYFLTCYNGATLPRNDSSARKCCEYRALRNCAPQSVEEKCGAAAALLVHEDVQNINGAALELLCADTSIRCS